MPVSLDSWNGDPSEVKNIISFIKKTVPRESKILDIGAGVGLWYHRLNKELLLENDVPCINFQNIIDHSAYMSINKYRDPWINNYEEEGIYYYLPEKKDAYYQHIDGIEIFEEYITKFHLSNLYSTIYQGNILEFDFDFYDLIIMGDVLEHIHIKPAQELIRSLISKSNQLLVGVPYQLQQGTTFGNEYETHHQPDLTKEVMLKRYPELNYLCGNSSYGYFISTI